MICHGWQDSEEDGYGDFKSVRKSVIDSIIGVGVKLLVHMVAIAKKILGFGIVVLFIGTVLCYQDWIQAAFLACMGGVLKFIVFAGEFIDAVMDLFRERICALILG